MRSIGMFLDAAKECSGRILANLSKDQSTSAGMEINEIGNVVNKARDNDERSSLTLLLDCTYRLDSE
jgi:hypothetical protein